MEVIVIGAGPVGLEAAARLQDDGHQVRVVDQGEAAAGVASWGHVTLFTPWSMLTTERGRQRIGRDFDDAALPTGSLWRREYLLPLADTLDVLPHHTVRSVARFAESKGSHIGKATRAEDRFRLLVDTPQGEAYLRADAVIDCTGVLGDPRPAGAGGLQALGEARAHAAGLVHYGPVNASEWGNQRVLLIGDGASAVTVLDQLLDAGATVEWVTANERGPGFASEADDPLPARRQLHQRAREAVRSGAVTHRPQQWVEAFAEHDSGLLVTLHGQGDPLPVDLAVCCTGFRPDLGLHRELQVHSCYASEGPMKLAAALLGDAGGDCLAPKAGGPELLVNPEPRFFVLGAKSYGRRNDFLLQNGHRQVEDVATLLR